MGRQPRPLDPTAGPAQAFAAELRTLREQAGNPKYLLMARQTGKSRTALAEAAGGDHLPTWETVAAFVTACRGNPNMWRIKWEQVREELQAAAKSIPSAEAELPPETAEIAVPDPRDHDHSELSVADATVVDTPDSPSMPNVADPDPTKTTAIATLTDPPDLVLVDDSETRPPPGQPPSRLRRTVPFAATALLAATIATVATVLIMTAAMSHSSDSTSPALVGAQTQTAAIVTVQNKVALGTSQLLEDATPAYLSTQPRPSCANNGCKVPGTELASGAMLVAVCHVTGTEISQRSSAATCCT